MKTLAIIWLAVLISGIAAVKYVDAEINKLIVNKPYTVQYVNEPYNPQQTISGYRLQPAATVQPNFTTTYNPQPAAGGLQ